MHMLITKYKEEVQNLGTYLFSSHTPYWNDETQELSSLGFGDR